jgi:hypothetical protein
LHLLWFSVNKKEVNNMRKTLIFLIMFTFVFPAYSTTIYKWVDEKGVVNFTDDFNNVPSPYRGQVEAKEYITEGGSPLTTEDRPASSVLPQTKEEVRADIYGRDETWWRERVSPWNERLQEATSNRDRTQNEIVRRAEELGTKTFWSRSQYQIQASGVARLKEAMMMYEAQIAEVRSQLAKLSKEAEETKANPEWLR